MREEKDPSRKSPRSRRRLQRRWDQDKALRSRAAFTLLLLTAASIAALFWQVLSEENTALLRPTAIVALAGLAGGLVCVSTRTRRSFERDGWIQEVYSWLLTAFAGATTSLLVFFLAALAFERWNEFNYIGLGEFGLVTGYLGASVAMRGALGWRPSLKSPLDRVNREIGLQMERILPSLQPRVSRLMEEAILGPPIPPYNGYVAVLSSLTADHLVPDAVTPQRTGISLAVWFDTAPPEVNLATIRDRSQLRRWVYPIVVRGRGSLAAADHDVIHFDVLFHVSTMRESPIRNSAAVPLEGRSTPFSLSVPSVALTDGVIPADSLLEIRCRGALIQMIDLQGLGGFANG
jgi:hypothetical protein